jgi:Bacterial SH3 domain
MSLSLKKYGLVALAGMLGLGVFGVTAPAQAATTNAQIEMFHATCSNFSVDLMLSGVNNDQDGWDRFQFRVVDGEGKVLYLENTARQTGIANRATVANLSYAVEDGKRLAPRENPIRFQIVDTDILQRPVNVIAERAFDSLCLRKGAADVDGLAGLLPQGVKGFISKATPLYTMPNGPALPLRAEVGREFTAIYQTQDGAWLALYTGGENFVWVRSTDMDIDRGTLRVVPDRVDASQQVSGAPIPGAPVATALVRFRSNFRQGPSTRFARIRTLPFGVTVPVYGRNTLGSWIFVSYEGVGGWVSARLIQLDGVRITDLPIVG